MTRPHRKDPTRAPAIKFVNLVSFEIPTSDFDNQTIWGMTGRFRAAGIIFQRGSERGREAYRVRAEDHKRASVILELVREELRTPKK
jgi:hypothetical protein